MYECMCALNSVHMEKKHNQNYIAPFQTVYADI